MVMKKINMKDNNNNKGFPRLLVLFLGFSYVLLLSSSSVSATRILKANNENPPPVQDIIAQDSMELKDVSGMEEKYFEGRMDIERTDYPGTGANPHHDPKSPGKA